MKKWIKRILMIVGSLLLVLILVILGFLFYFRHTAMSIYYMKKEMNDKAVPHLEKMVRNPDNREERVRRFMLLYPQIDDEMNNKEICEMVISDSTKLIELEPDRKKYYKRARNYTTAKMHYYSSWAHFKSCDYEKSADEYMLAHNQKLPNFYCGENAPSFGHVNGSAIGFDKALSYYNIYIEKYPNAGHAFYFRGKIYADNNNYEKALDDFDKAIELCADSKPNDTLFSYGGFLIDKAETCEKLGKTKEAIEAYKEYIKFGDNSYHSLSDAEVSDRIKALEGGENA